MRRFRIIPNILRGLIGLLALQTVLIVLLITQTDDAPSRAVLSMGLSLIAAWVVVGGGLMYRFRDAIRARVRRIRWDWRVTFVLFATLLALIEEAITVTLTNLAPLFGVAVGEAYITATANYLELVALHSVVVFVPMFVAWAWLLSRYDFRPAEVFLLFGLTGFLAEAMSFGATLFALPMWIFVYGLLVYLPAYSIPPERGVRPVRCRHYPLAVIFPIIAAIPVIILILQFQPTPTQFAPMVFPE